MKKLILTALAALTATVSAPAMADKWKRVATNIEHGVVLYLNVSSIRSAGDNKTCWFAWVRTSKDNSDYDYALSKERINCIEETASQLVVYAYKNGNIVDSSTKPLEPHSPPPGSFMARGIENACFNTVDLADGKEMETPNELVGHATELMKELKNENKK